MLYSAQQVLIACPGKDTTIFHYVMMIIVIVIPYLIIREQAVKCQFTCFLCAYRIIQTCKKKNHMKKTRHGDMYAYMNYTYV